MDRILEVVIGIALLIFFIWVGIFRNDREP